MQGLAGKAVNLYELNFSNVVGGTKVQNQNDDREQEKSPGLQPNNQVPSMTLVKSNHITMIYYDHNLSYPQIPCEVVMLITL